METLSGRPHAPTVEPAGPEHERLERRGRGRRRAAAECGGQQCCQQRGPPLAGGGGGRRRWKPPGPEGSPRDR